MRVGPDEIKVGDILPNPHLSGVPGRVVKVTPTSYGAMIEYEYAGNICVSGVFRESVRSFNRWIPAGIEVER